MMIKAKLLYQDDEADGLYHFRLYAVDDGRELLDFKVKAYNREMAINECVYYMVTNNIKCKIIDEEVDWL